MNTAFRPAAPNPMFPDEVTALMRFARTDEDHTCPVCGTVGRRFWTMLVPFIPQVDTGFTFKAASEQEALVLVCEEHPLAIPERFKNPIGVVDDPPGDFDWSTDDDENED